MSTRKLRVKLHGIEFDLMTGKPVNCKCNETKPNLCNECFVYTWNGLVNTGAGPQVRDYFVMSRI